jgi:arylsulfatase A-like enzyme
MSQHGIVTFQSSIPPSFETLAEALRARGYATGGFLANALLSGNRGFERGFDQFHALWAPAAFADHAGKAPADAVNKQALAWLDKVRPTGQPFFLYLHYFEPHNPYAPPGALVERMFAGRPHRDLKFLNDSMMLAKWIDPDEQTRDDIELLYDAEVASLDASLAAFFADLRERKVLDDTIVVVTADHGEEFGDHGGYGHGGTLYNELIRVPLVIVVPGDRGGRRIGRTASLVDVAPTLVEMTGGQPPSSFEGRSLRPSIRPATSWWAPAAEDPEPEVPAFSELIVSAELEAIPWARARPHKTALMLGRWKLILGSHGESEFYDLTADWNEQHLRGGTFPRENEMRLMLAGFASLMRGGAPPRAPDTVDPQLAEKMRALGYVQ